MTQTTHESQHRQRIRASYPLQINMTQDCLLPCSRNLFLLVLFLALMGVGGARQQGVAYLVNSSLRHGRYRPFLSSRLLSQTESGSSEQGQETRPSCFYKSPAAGGRFVPRVELSDLKVGDELEDCHVFQELLDGKTGPKLFLECGVGRCRDENDKWKIVTGMLRLTDRKESAYRKRAARLRKKATFPAYVSRIRLDNDHLEVCLQPHEVQDRPRKPPISSLKVGQEVTGVVTRLEDYGALIDVGANRHGLLHIQRVADLYGRYIHKTKGLEEAGLERGSRLKLKVSSNEPRRLLLDFTDDVKEQAAKEREQQTRPRKETSQQPKEPSSVEEEAPPYDISEEEAAAWAQYAGYDEEDDDEDDYYDEDRDIEDALGLGSY